MDSLIPKDFVEECIYRVLNRFYEPKEPVVSVPRKEVLMVMPYLGNMSVVLKRDILKLVRKFYLSIDGVYELAICLNFRIVSL